MLVYGEFSFGERLCQLNSTCAILRLEGNYFRGKERRTRVEIFLWSFAEIRSDSIF